MIVRESNPKTNKGYDFAFHELAHWCVQAINVTMRSQLEGPLRIIPLW